MGHAARSGSLRFLIVAVMTLFGCLLGWPFSAAAQTSAGNAASDAQSVRLDAVLATPNQRTPVPQDGAIATAPGQTQPTPRPQVTVNLLAPLFFNSNAEAVGSGGTATAEGSPVVRVSAAGQLGDLPIRISGSVSTEWDRFVHSNGADFDKIRPNLRAQYVDPSNDQAYSPFIAFVPRLDFEPTFATKSNERYDLDIGINKAFDFDAGFRRIAPSGNASASTIWSLGFTAGAQRRWSNPIPSSYAVFLIPSASYVISDAWNAELVLDLTQRWYDVNGEREFTVMPIGVLEYVVPDRWLGGASTARWLGNPSVDFVVSYERNWANFPHFTFTQWVAGVVFKAGWRF